MSTTMKSAMIAAGVAMIALTGAVGGAQAGGKGFKLKSHHFKHHHFHKPHFVYKPIVVHDGCYFYKKMWFKTGSYHWKEKYYVCRGWW